MRTVEAVTDPLVAAGPKALTQSPTARSVEAALWVALTGVELDVVTLSVWTLGVGGFFDLLWLVLGKLPGDTEMPEMVRVDALTAVTLPEAMDKLASCRRKLPGDAPFGKPPPPPGGPPPLPLRNWNPPAVPPALIPMFDPPAPLVEVPTQAPLLLGMLTERSRAATVVFDFLEAVPVAVTQSPTVIALTASVTVLENCVDEVQLTVVWPLLGFCTSMLVALSAATDPKAPVGALVDVAAPAVDATVPAARSAVAPVPRICAQRLLGIRLPVSGSMLAVASFFPVRVCCRWDVGSRYSVRRASIGASEAARLAGYTPKRTPMASAMASAPTAAVGLVEMGSPINPGR
jgi:hypothetical protein